MQGEVSRSFGVCADTETSTGEIVSRVSSDTILVQEAMSEKVGQAAPLCRLLLDDPLPSLLNLKPVHEESQ